MRKRVRLGRVLIFDAIFLLVILSMFVFVKCRKRDAFTDKGDYKTLSIAGKWYKVDLDTITVVDLSKDGKYEERDISGNLMKSGTYEVGNHAMRIDKEILSMRYVDEAEVLEDAIEGDASGYELRKYFYTVGKTKKTYYFHNEIEAADQVEDYCSTNEYMEKMGMFDENGFAIDGNGVLLAYRGEAEEVTLPAEVEEIAENAMSADYGRATKTKKVVIPSTVKKINTGAFSFSKVEIVVIEQGVESIGHWAFGDSSIREIHFPATISNLEKGILDTEEGLKEMKIFCKAGSQVEQYFKENPPEGKYEMLTE